MNEKLKLILLIDDNEADNFFHKMVIEKSKTAEKVVAINSAIDALKYLKSKQDGDFPHPCLIFLDINMPKMNGWEFLEEYKKLPAEQKAKVMVVMLTTSCSPDAKEKANLNKDVRAFQTKPLTQEVLDNLIEEFFC